MVDHLDVVLPSESADLPPGALVAAARAAEGLGYGRVLLPDHLLPPGEYRPDAYGGVYEPLTTLAHLAAHTERVGLSMSVLVLPLREPVLVAKQAATVDRLSGGRLTLGIGVGWDRAEYAAVGADFATRGARADEALRLLRHLFEGDGPFHGRFTSFDQGVFAPRPGRRVPILVGGMSDAALRRAAALGDEWQAVTPDADEFARKVARLREFGDRDVVVGTRVAWTGGDSELRVVVEQVRALREAGAQRVAVWFGHPDGFTDRMARFLDAAG